MLLSDFDYDLPEELIAQQPLAQRDASRMLVVNRADGTFRNDGFVSLPEHLRPGDCLVLNNTKVFPARLVGQRVPSGGSIEVLLLQEEDPDVWEVLARPARRLRVGARISFGPGKLEAIVTAANEDGTRVINFEPQGGLWRFIDELGQPPLPPYIKRHEAPTPNDRERYQTVYAQEKGSIAAPTAGLHFTQAILDQLKQRGVRVANITLHVGYGTFEPVRVDDISKHRVLAEAFSIDSEAAELINSSRASGGRVVAVGTTTTRALESASSQSGELGRSVTTTDLTITPGHKFKIVDALLTNFHLPRSSLLLLVSAFAGRELVLNAYRHAVRDGYRFYSYGDCMLIF